MDERRRNAFANAMQLITQMENVSKGGGTRVMGSAIAPLTFVISVRKHPNSTPNAIGLINIQAPPIFQIFQCLWTVHHLNGCSFRLAGMSTKTFLWCLTVVLPSLV